jgi:pimeloyl-ACP methyl ester carboxylesterase
MNGYADDLAAVIEALDLRDATLVGHSTGGGGRLPATSAATGQGGSPRRP